MPQAPDPCINNLISSDIVGIRIAKEKCAGELPDAPVWVPYEPNSIGSLGGEITTISSNPISPSRQTQKGTPVSTSSSPSISYDFKYNNTQDLLEGYLFSNAMRKSEIHATAVSGSGKTYSVSETTDLVAGSLLHGSKFHDAANNGLKEVESVSSNSSITVAENLVDESSSPSGALLVHVGHEFTTSEVSIDVSGSLPALVSKSFDFLTFGLSPGEFIFLGDSNTINKFPNPSSNGFKRVRSVSQNKIEFDKTALKMIEDAGQGRKIRIFFGRVFKNSGGTGVTQPSFQIEATLGAPDSSKPDEIQAVYNIGCMCNELAFTFPTTDKITVDASFVGKDSIPHLSSSALKSGARPTIAESSMLNTSTDIQVNVLSLYKSGISIPRTVFTFLRDFDLTIGNALTPESALGVFGSIGSALDSFTVTGNMTAYMENVEIMEAVRLNMDVTFHTVIARDNTGIVIDLPLITLGGVQPTIEKASSIMLPITFNAHTGKDLQEDLDHTILFVFFDYLPTISNGEL